MAELAAGAAIHSSAGVPDGDKQKPYLVARDVEGATYQDSLDGLKVYSKKLKHEGLFEYSGLDMADDILSRNQKYIHKVIGAGEIAGGITMQAGGMLGSMPSGGASLFAIGAGGVMTVSGHSKMAGRYESSEGAAVLRSFAEPTGSYYFHSMGEAVAYDTLAASVGGKVLEGAVRLSAKTFAPSIKTATRESVMLETSAAKAELKACDGAATRVISTKPIEWAAPKGTYQTYKVYQRNDINWNQVRTSGPRGYIGRTNEEAAKVGLAPQLSDGNFVTLHHLGQDSRGGLVEASTRYHGVGKSGQDVLHGVYGKNKPNPEFPVDHKTWVKESKEYWKNRVKQ